jgi:hypothetical protein
MEPPISILILSTGTAAERQTFLSITVASLTYSLLSSNYTYTVAKFETYIPRNETVWPCSQFLHSCIWERFIYSHYRSYLEFLFPVLRERTLGSTAGAERRAVPSPPLGSCS